MSYSDNTCPQVVRCDGDNTNGEDDDEYDGECDGNGDDDYDGHGYGSLCGDVFLLKKGEIVDSRICSSF